jgi:hypothetical protein
MPVVRKTSADDVTHSFPRRESELLAEKVIGWTIGALTSLAVAYFAWYRIPGYLWRWANEAWWHWGPALLAYLILLIAPIWMMVGAGSLLAADGTGPRRRMWWARLGYVGMAAAILLILWAVTPRPVPWFSWHWCLWGAAVVSVSIVSAAGWMLFSFAPDSVSMTLLGFRSR